MNQVLSAVWVMAALIGSALVLMQAIFGTTSVQAGALQDATRVTIERSQTRLTIGDLTGGDLLLGTNLTVPVANTGEVSIQEPAEMDVFIQYTQVNNQRVVKRLAHASSFVSCSLVADQWCLESLSPDSIDPQIWDPNEEATLKLRVQPGIKKNTIATIVVVTPNGITAIGSFLNT